MCPVYEMEAGKSIRSSHNGKTYYSCSAAERDVFDKHPKVIDRFLAEDLKQTGK